jgi:hypothetical protein
VLSDEGHGVSVIPSERFLAKTPVAELDRRDVALPRKSYVLVVSCMPRAGHCSSAAGTFVNAVEHADADLSAGPPRWQRRCCAEKRSQ